MVACARGAMEVERLSRLTRLTPLITSYESLSEGEKAEVATSLQNITKDSPADLRIGEATSELETDRPNSQSDYSWGNTDTPCVTNVPPRSVTKGDSTGSPLDKVTSQLRSLAIATDHVEGSTTCGPSQVLSMLVALYSSYLASVRQMGVLLSSRTVLPRPEEQDDETTVTQELSQAQRRLVREEEWIWKRLSELTGNERIEGDVSFLARELEDKSAKILTSYERRNNPPTNEVYDQSRTILQAMGVPCITTADGVEGEALAAALVRDGLAHCVASEDTVGFFCPFRIFVG